jgi:hypothetical protein
MWLAWREERQAEFYGEISKERHNFENLVIHGRTTLKMIVKKDSGLWVGFIWLRIGRSGGFPVRLC